jgi:hypothetical protein
MSALTALMTQRSGAGWILSKMFVWTLPGLTVNTSVAAPSSRSLRCSSREKREFANLLRAYDVYLPVHHMPTPCHCVVMLPRRHAPASSLDGSLPHYPTIAYQTGVLSP